VTEISENQLKAIMKPAIVPIVVPKLTIKVLPEPKITKKKEKNDESQDS
jgi:hypothetical protein